MKIAVDATTMQARDGGAGAGIEQYTRSISRALSQAAPDRVRLVAPIGRVPFVSRHLLLPLAAALRGCRVLFAPSGQIPLGWRGRSVITVHDVAIYDHPEWFSELGRQDFSVRVSVPDSIARADRIIAVSEATRRALEARFPEARGKTTVVHEGVSRPEHIAPLSPAARDTFGLKEDTILFVGTIEPRKNIETAVRAFDAFLRSHPERATTTRFVIAGKRGWNAEGIDREIARVNSQWSRAAAGDVVVPVGYVTDEQKWALYASASVFLFPSWDEGFGLPLLEALSVGTPVIASNRGALPEIGGDAVIYVEPDDAEQMALQIAQCVLMPEAMGEMREAGKQHAAPFTWDRAAGETLKVIASVTTSSASTQ